LPNVTLESTERAVYSESQSRVQNVFREGGRRPFRSRDISASTITLLLALCASVVPWLSTIRSPLWLDETISYWQISGGFRQIWARQGLSFPAYSYILWATNFLFGSNEVVLRMPSVLAMLAAAYLLYRIAREFSGFEVAVIVTVLFCLHPIVAFAAVDARPYAFGVLTLNCAILSFLRWAKTNSSRYAILFGISAAGIFYFHYLFGVILAAFAFILIGTRGREWRLFAPQFAVACVMFVVVMLPVISRLAYLFRTGPTHVFANSPRSTDLLITIAPGVIFPLFVGALFVAALLGKVGNSDEESALAKFSSLLMAGVPLVFLYSVSSLTNMHVFVERYRLVAIPGIALCWGLLVSCIRSSVIRLSFCLALITFTLTQSAFPTLSIENPHGYTWKYALEAANRKAASDSAPLLLCSDLPESNFESMPADVASSGFFAPVSYYKVNSPVVPLPREFNKEAALQVKKFLATAIPARRRFLVLAFVPSWHTIDWITMITKNSYEPRKVGTYDGITVMEYVPR